MKVLTPTIWVTLLTGMDFLGAMSCRRRNFVSGRMKPFLFSALRENPWADKNVEVHATTLSRIGPGFVSEAEADIQRRSVYEYLDPAAPSGCLQVSAAEFDLHPPVILMKRSPFIISNRSQREVISDLSWKSVVYIWGGPAVTLLGVWGILKHLQLWGVLP